MADYVASNDTPEGRAQNRRVEIYISANQQMIEQAQAGTLKALLISILLYKPPHPLVGEFFC